MNYKKLLITAVSIQLSAMDERLLGNGLENPYAAANAPALQEELEKKDYSVHLDIARLILDAYDAKLVDHNMPENQELTRKFIDDQDKHCSDFMELLSVYYFATFNKNREEETYFGAILRMAEQSDYKFIDEKAIISSCKILSRSPVSGSKGGGYRQRPSRISAISDNTNKTDKLKALRMFLRAAITESQNIKPKIEGNIPEIRKIPSHYVNVEVLLYKHLVEGIQDVKNHPCYMETLKYQYLSKGLHSLIIEHKNMIWRLECYKTTSTKYIEDKIAAEKREIERAEERKRDADAMATKVRAEEECRESWNKSHMSLAAHKLLELYSLHGYHLCASVAYHYTDPKCKPCDNQFCNSKCNDVYFLRKLLENPQDHIDEFSKSLRSSHSSAHMNRLRSMLENHGVSDSTPIETILSVAASKIITLNKFNYKSRDELRNLQENLDPTCFDTCCFWDIYTDSKSELRHFINDTHMCKCTLDKMLGMETIKYNTIKKLLECRNNSFTRIVNIIKAHKKSTNEHIQECNSTT